MVVSEETIPILPPGRIFWGILEAVEPVGDGLLLARISGREYLVDESLQPVLAGLLGKPATIGHVDGKWRAGRCTGLQ